MRNFYKNVDVADIPLQELKKLDAETLISKFKLIIYSKEDIDQINEALATIRKVLHKHEKKWANSSKAA